MAEFETKVEELNRLGENLLAAGNVDEACTYFQQAEEADPSFIGTYINQAKAMISVGALQQAKSALDKAMMLDRGNADVLFHMSNVCFLSELYEDGILYANEALESGCELPMLYYNMAVAYEEMGKTDRALHHYSKAINLAPLEGSYYLGKINCQLRINREEDALQTLEQLHKNCPDSFEAYHFSFVLHARRHEYEKAQRILEEGIENFPGDPGLYLDMVHLMNITKNAEEAIQLLDALDEVQEEMNLDIRELKVERAKASMIQEDTEQARKLLEEAVAMQGAPTFEAHYLLMNCCMAQQDYKRMAEVAKIMSEADDHTEFSRAARYYYPMALKKQNLDDEAAAAYEDAIRYYRMETLKHPEEVDAHMFRAMCNKDLQRFDEALSVLDYLCKLIPNYPPAQLVRSAIYTEMGETQKAKESFDSAGPLKDVLDDVVGTVLRTEKDDGKH